MNTINFRNLVLLLSASTVYRCSELDIRPHRSSYYNFTLSDPISQTVRSVYDYVCGATVFCNNSLGRFEWKRESCYKCQECHCDTLCDVYGDCCIDKYDYKPPPYPLPYTTCLQFNPKTCETQKKMPVYYRAINRCPFNFEKIDVVRKCQSTDISDYETALAVWSISTNKTYINIFCALCHGELSRDMRRWSAYVSCRDETIFNGLQDYGAIWRTAMSHNSCCIHKIKEPNGALERPCKPDVVDNCPQKANKTVLDLYMEDNCNSTGFDVFDYTSKITYRNVFCAACNGVVIARFLHGACFMQHELRTKSLGVLINFNPIIKDVTIDSNSQEKSICTGTEVIDPLTTTCHKVVCDGRRFLDGDRCVNIFGDAKGLDEILPRPIMNSSNRNLTNFSNSVNLANGSDLEPYEIFLLNFSRILYEFGLPFITGLGIVMNTLSALVFMSKDLRDNGSSVCLTFLSFIDSAFLVTLIVQFLHLTKVDIYRYGGMCEFVVFTTYSCSFTSVWLIVVITTETYLISLSVHHVQGVYSCARGLAVSLFFVLFSCIFYSFSFWTTIKKSGIILDLYVCDIEEGSERFVLAMTYVDLSATLVLPYGIIIFMLCSIFLNKVWSRTMTCLRHSVALRSRNTTNALMRVATLLMALSISYLLFTVPSYIFKFGKLFYRYPLSNKERVFQGSIQYIVQFIYYLSYFYKFFVYFIFGENFRRIFKRYTRALFKRCMTR